MSEIMPVDLWERVVATLPARLGDTATRMWISDLRALRLGDDVLELAAPTPFYKDRFEKNYAAQVRDAVIDLVGHPIRLEITLLDRPTDELDDSDDIEPEGPTPGGPVPAPAPAPVLNPRYVFDAFVTGPSNSFAHAAALAVAEQANRHGDTAARPARSYNPLFIYGGAGLGKTHLLHAIGHETYGLYPQAVVRYVSSEQFMNDFIQCIREDKMDSFRRRYREPDLLLIDDIQFLSRGDRTQEEFFHTFNALHNDGRQIVITSDRPPGEIPTLEDRLRTRFEWGLITDVQPPDLETRVAILQKKAAAEGFLVPNEVLGYIATRVLNNIRELEGRLLRVVTFATLTEQALTLKLAEEVLQPLLPDEDASLIPIGSIISTCAEYFGLTKEELLSKNRSKNFVHARQIAMYISREQTPLSYPKIGEAFDRDHTTVLYAVDKIRESMQQRRHIYQQVQDLTARLRGRPSGVANL